MYSVAMPNLFLKIFRQMLFYFLLIGFWYLLSSMKLWPQYQFPSPEQVLEALREGVQNRSFLLGILVSMKRIVLGYLIAVIFGVTLGFLIGKVRILDETIGGLFVGLKTLPSICWLPLAMLWFGKNEMAITFLVNKKVMAISFLTN